jgi:hypothetical protein
MTNPSPNTTDTADKLAIAGAQLDKTKENMETWENFERQTRENLSLTLDRLRKAENTGDDDAEERTKKIYQDAKTHWSITVMEVLKAQKKYNMALYNYLGEMVADESERDGGMEPHFSLKQHLTSIQVLRSLENAAFQTTVVKKNAVIHELISPRAGDGDSMTASTDDDSTLSD